MAFTDRTIFPGLHQFLHEVQKEIPETSEKYLKIMGDPPCYDLELSQDDSRTISEYSMKDEEENSGQPIEDFSQNEIVKNEEEDAQHHFQIQ